MKQEEKIKIYTREITDSSLNKWEVIEVSDLEDIMQESLIELEQVTKKANAFEGVINGLQFKVDEQAKDIKELKALQGATKAVNVLQGQSITELESKLEDRDKQITELNDIFLEVNERIEEKSEEVTRLKGDLEHYGNMPI